MTAMIEAPNVLVYRDLIDQSLWDRLTKRIVKDYAHLEITAELAEQIMSEALGFLQLCALRPEGIFGPSELVDIGWHTFILYTREYAAFCDRIAGHFIHHMPTDEEGVDYGTGMLATTLTALREIGPVNELLWLHGDSCTSKCNRCNNCGCRRDDCRGGDNGGGS